MTNEEFVSIARNTAKAILAGATMPGNGGYTSDFGPVVYGNLIKIVTMGSDGYCDRNGHLFNRCDRCSICGERDWRGL
jgi:hypothetical protein